MKTPFDFSTKSTLDLVKEENLAKNEAYDLVHTNKYAKGYKGKAQLFDEAVKRIFETTKGLK